MTNQRFLMRGYGGCLNPPCRQRHSAPLRLLSRAIKERSLPLPPARPVDGFKGFDASLSACGARQGDTGALDGISLSNDLAFIGVSSRLRFLIISEVCLTGETFNYAVNMPVSLALTGFEGF